MGAQAERVFPVFFGVWIVLGVLSGAFFFFNRNASLKRKVYPPFVIGTGMLFLGFVALMGFPLDTFFYLVMVPFVVVITFLNLRKTKFCNSCGRTLWNQNLITTPNYCPKCGAKLEDDA